MEVKMCKFLLMVLLMVTFITQAEEIRGDKNHDGALSGEEQFLRDDSPTPTPEPEAKKTVLKKTVPRTFPAVGVTEINTGYQNGWVARADGLQVDPQRLKYLQADILHATSDGYKQRTAESNAIVQQRSERETIARTIELAQKDHIDLESMLWRLKIEGYKHIMPPMKVLEDAGTVLNDLQRAKEFTALMQNRQRAFYGTSSYGQVSTQNLPYYSQTLPVYYGYVPQGQVPIQNPQSVTMPTIRDGSLEYNYNCNLPTIREGRMECH
jgi:hypothetical protein